MSDQVSGFFPGLGVRPGFGSLSDPGPWKKRKPGLISKGMLVDPAPDCWPPTAVMLAVAVSARAPTTDPRIEITLSPGLRTSPLPVTPAGVADRWWNIR